MSNTINNNLPKPDLTFPVEFAYSLEDDAQKELKQLKRKINQTYQNNPTSPHSPQTPPSKKQERNASVTTPPRTKYIAMPSTPAAKKTFSRIHTQKPLFQDDLQKIIFKNPINSHQDDQFSNIDNPTGFLFNTVYKNNGHTYTIVQQISKKDCGAAAFLMLFTDLMRLDENKLNFSDPIWKWATSCSLINAASLLEKCNPFLKNSSYQLERKIFRIEGDDENAIIASSKEVIIDEIQSILKTSKFSVILSITHPEIKGHWIVVDSIDREKNEIYIRDPFSGKAYLLTFDELSRSIEKHANTDCIFIAKQPEV